MYDKAILHLDLDAFFVSVERQANSDLIGKPIIIGGDAGRGVVSSCSYEARAFGVHSAMPMKMAKYLCPEATIIQGDMDNYTKASNLVTDIIREDAPIFEKASIDEFYLDLTGMDKFFGCYKWSKELRAKIISNTGLPISVGLSVNKLISKMSAGEAKPNGEIEVKSGTERDYIAPLSVAKIPQIGKVAYKKLSFMGVRTVKILRDIPIVLLQREFGKMGAEMWRRSNAIDNRKVIPYSEKKSISKERTFGIDTIDVHKIRSVIIGMVSKLAYELRSKGKLTSIVTIKIRYTDFNTYTKQKRIPYTASDRVLIQWGVDLFEKLYSRRQLIRLVGIKFGGLVSGHSQINLFDDTIKDINLQQQMDAIKNRFGKNAIRRASSV